MWYQVFLWALFSSIFAHVVAALIAFCRLRKHRYGRWIPVVVFGMGIISPLTGGVITSKLCFLLALNVLTSVVILVPNTN